MQHKNNKMLSASCIQCDFQVPLADYPTGCPSCKTSVPSNMKVIYSESAESNSSPEDLKNWYLPWNQSLLGEGSTRLIRVNTPAGKVFLKDEGQNPTGSHKDRFSSFFVRWAQSQGFQRVLAASSGNAGISLATYASAKKLKCSVAVTKATDETILEKLTSLDAEVVVFDTAHERWQWLETEWSAGKGLPATNFTIPAIGSHYIGIQAFKAISYELIEQLSTHPEAIFVPTSRGDLIWGIFEGFRELRAASIIDRVPKMVAVEPTARLSLVLSGNASISDSFVPYLGKMKSIAGSTATFQSLQAIRKSNGSAVVVSDTEAYEAKAALRSKGVEVETSSAAAYAAYQKINDSFQLSGPCVVLATSRGLWLP